MAKGKIKNINFRNRMAVFLDRDGTLNKAYIEDGLPISPSSLNKFKIIKGVKKSINRLKKLNFLCILITNQPDVFRGKISKKTVVKMNSYIKKKIKLDDMFVCYHDNEHNCSCRKPKPGLLVKASKKWKIDLNKSFMIGDRWKDILAGKKVGCKTIFINNNYKNDKKVKADFTFKSLLKAVNKIEKLRKNII
jgi:D-glycero-D-manno-heptose 1,7-bisphosphate phosphatase